MLSGLIPDARDLEGSVPVAGLLTSAFAVGMIIGAPLMAIASMLWPRRRVLLTFLITFMLVHVIGALTSSFEVLLVTRIVGALADAGFLAAALGDDGNGARRHERDSNVRPPSAVSRSHVQPGFLVAPS